jgi:hypothetical protein
MDIFFNPEKGLSSSKTTHFSGGVSLFFRELPWSDPGKATLPARNGRMSL